MGTATEARLLVPWLIPVATPFPFCTRSSDEDERLTTKAAAANREEKSECKKISPLTPADTTTALAPGFRFHPTDEELVSYYLKRKVANKPVRFNPIAEIDIYKNEPWDLAVCIGVSDKSSLKSRDQEWYFFSALDKKYTNGARMNRATGKGYWKATGKDREIKRDSQIIAMKKTLVFHSGRAPGGQRTNWVMHEYRLHEEEYERMGSAQAETYVLCRVFHKTNIGPPNGNRYAPFIEEEWDEDKEGLVPGDDQENVPKPNQTDQDSCKREKPEEFPLLPIPIKRQKSNETGSHGSLSEENSTWFSHGPSSSTTTDLTMMTTNSATTTAASALLEFSLMDRKQSSSSSPPSARFDLSIPPNCMKFISEMQSSMQKISVERDTLRLELMSAQAMMSILQSRTEYMRKENEDLKRLLLRNDS